MTDAELIEELATKVMGYEVSREWKDQTPIPRGDEEFERRIKIIRDARAEKLIWRDGVPLQFSAWNPLSDFNVAMEIVDKIRTSRIPYPHLSIDYWSSEGQWSFQINGNVNQDTWDKDFKRAICKAALSSVRQ